MSGQGLTVLQADEIRRLNAGAVRSRQIAEITGVPIRTVNDVLLGRRDGRQLTPREQAELDRQAGWKAACLDDIEWAEWLASNPLLPDGMAAARPCNDCPLGFAADMRAQGRCNGTPGGVAADPDEPEEEDTVEPVIPAIARPDPGIRIGVSLKAPCGSCEKADVCSLRPAVEALTELPVLVPVLDNRVGLELAGSVTCSAFVRSRIRKAEPTELAKSTVKDRDRRDRVIEAVRRNNGDVKAAAAELGELPHVVSRLWNTAQREGAAA